MTDLSYSEIKGTGSYVPRRVLTNQDLERMLKERFPDDQGKWTTDEWIVQRTGIRERRIATPDETNARMGTLALQNALNDAEVSADQLDLIVVGTNTNETNFPGCGAEIQATVGATCPFFDIQAGCTGFVSALSVADAFIRSGQYETIGVVGTDRLSGITDYRDRETCVLFGDMACAWLLKRSDRAGIIKCILGGDGKGRDLIGLTHPDLARLRERETGVQTSEIYTTGQGYLHMDGKAVFRFAAAKLPNLCIELLDCTDYTLRNVTKIFPHNANLCIVDAAAKRLARQTGISTEGLFYHNIDTYGNTSAASCANSFHEARKEGVIKEGDLAILAAFGAGLTWGGALIRL